jgi:hypothetical protein
MGYEENTTYFTPRIKLDRDCFFGSILFRRAAGVDTIISGWLTGQPCSQSNILFTILLIIKRTPRMNLKKVRDMENKKKKNKPWHICNQTRRVRWSLTCRPQTAATLRSGWPSSSQRPLAILTTWSHSNTLGQRTRESPDGVGVNPCWEAEADSLLLIRGTK